eukprot:NODE_3400_length_984_cov_16.095187_g3122_i0.p1 GENE.NODE_3400_length_984_cov_16.095187_g3122_i0~~NODE_3400_length_984_cov_16.095187_g3122_i0.p1  ORF type:complete len:261 (+),score=47.19 NODE_3400_length_984_cov_16.095187_g3122_i0:85-867(+)
MDDYLGDAILQSLSCEQEKKEKVPRSLSKLRQQQSRALAAQHRPTVMELQAEVRQQGLETPIASSNKGFQMLARMGYKPGTALGKKVESHKPDNIPLAIKRSRHGLGSSVDSEPRRKAQRTQTSEAVQAATAYRQSVFSRRASQHLQKRFQRLARLAGTLEVSDVDAGDAPLWPVWLLETLRRSRGEELSIEELLADEERHFYEVSPEEAQLLWPRLVAHVREQFCYCAYCEVHFEDAEEMLRSCPGENSDDHEDADGLD